MLLEVGKCLESIIAQTYKTIEIIVVDDGSTDNSGEICDYYQSTDNRIKVFHKQNEGLSSARNFGIDQANGDYIGFIDSDDYIENDMYELLLDLAEEYDASISMCGLFDVYNNKPRKVFSEEECFVVNNEEAIRIVLEAKKVSVTAVNKLYKKSLFDNVRYPVGKTAEDAFVIVELLDKCDKVVITNKQKYYYIHRENSITTKAFSPKTMNTIEAYQKNYHIISEKYPRIIDIAKMRLCWAHFYVCDRIVFDNSPENKNLKREIINFIKHNIKYILHSEYFTTFRKLSAISLFLGTGLYRMCVTLQNKRYKIV